MKSCISEDCDRPIRMRPFAGSRKLYPEKTCRSCQGTLRRWGLTKPQRDADKRNGGDTLPPPGGLAL